MRSHGRIIIGTIKGNIDDIQLGITEGGSVSTILDPTYAEHVIKLGKPYFDFPICPVVHLAVNYATNAHLKVAFYLLKRGANFNDYLLPGSWSNNSINENVAYRGYPPAIMYALGFGQIPTNAHVGMLQRLHQSLPQIFNMTTIQQWLHNSGNPPLLHITTFTENLDASYLLMSEIGINVDEVDQHGITPLMVATWKGDLMSVVLLLSNKANRTKCDDFDRNALHYAAMRGDSHAANLLLTIPSDEYSPLESGKVLKQMLWKKDRNGQTPLMLASQTPRLENIISTLKNHSSKFGRQYLSLEFTSEPKVIDQPIDFDNEMRHDTSHATNDSFGEWYYPKFFQNVNQIQEIWKIIGVPVKDDDIVTIDKIDVDTLNGSEFMDHYFNAQKPVIITNLMRKQNFWAYWSRRDFVDRYGDLMIVGGVAAGFSSTTLRSYIDQYMRYGMEESHHDDQSCDNFDEMNSFSSKEVDKILHSSDAPMVVAVDSNQMPDSLARDFQRSSLFDICGENDVEREPIKLSLGPFHSICPSIAATNASWNGLIAGKKLWLLLPPGVALNYVQILLSEQSEFSKECARNCQISSQLKETKDLLERMKLKVVGEKLSIKQWITLIVPWLRYEHLLIEAIQNPGEVIYIPHDWSYAFLNLAETISISQEICTWFKTDMRIQPLGWTLYGGNDSYRGYGHPHTHRVSNYNLGITLPVRDHLPIFDLPSVT